MKLSRVIKAVFRGIFIALNSCNKEETSQKINEITVYLKKLRFKNPGE